MTNITTQAEIDAIKAKIAKFGATAHVVDEDGRAFVRVNFDEPKDAIILNENLLVRDLIRTESGWTFRPYWNAEKTRYEYGGVWGLSLDAFAREYGAHSTLYEAAHDAFRRLKAQKIKL